MRTITPRTQIVDNATSKKKLTAREAAFANKKISVSHRGLASQVISPRLWLLGTKKRHRKYSTQIFSCSQNAFNHVKMSDNASLVHVDIVIISTHHAEISIEHVVPVSFRSANPQNDFRYSIILGYHRVLF